MAQITGGAALLLGIYFTWRRVEIQQDQQVTERFTRAIDQLGATDEKEGKPKLEIRLGGIYALERIAKDSPKRDYAAIIEVLTAYVRENTPLPPKESTEAASVPNEAAEQSGIDKQQRESDAPTEQSLGFPPREELRTDIKAVLDVIGRRQSTRVPEEYRVTPDLRKTNFRRTNLREANLGGTNLSGADLSGADLSEADLSEADLSEADLSEADLSAAGLYNANLMGANLRAADLRAADLYKAALDGANLRAVDLSLTSFTQEQLLWAFGDETTKLPGDVEPPKSWTQSGGT